MFDVLTDVYITTKEGLSNYTQAISTYHLSSTRVQMVKLPCARLRLYNLGASIAAIFQQE